MGDGTCKGCGTQAAMCEHGMCANCCNCGGQS